MATHSCILVWKIPWTEEEPSNLQSMGLQRVGHDWAQSISHNYHLCCCYGENIKAPISQWFSSIQYLIQYFRSDQIRSVTQSCPTLCNPMNRSIQASLSITNSQSLLKLMSIELGMPSSHLILCRPLLLLTPIPPSIRVFSNESTPCVRWPKYWSFSFNISPSNEYSGLVSFRIDWLNLLAVQGTLKNLL